MTTDLSLLTLVQNPTKAADDCFWCCFFIFQNNCEKCYVDSPTECCVWMRVLDYYQTLHPVIYHKETQFFETLVYNKKLKLFPCQIRYECHIDLFTIIISCHTYRSGQLMVKIGFISRNYSGVLPINVHILSQLYFNMQQNTDIFAHG